jgi:hypothetical protein
MTEFQELSHKLKQRILELLRGTDPIFTHKQIGGLLSVSTAMVVGVAKANGLRRPRGPRKGSAGARRAGRKPRQQETAQQPGEDSNGL